MPAVHVGVPICVGVLVRDGDSATEKSQELQDEKLFSGCVAARKTRHAPARGCASEKHSSPSAFSGCVRKPPYPRKCKNDTGESLTLECKKV